VGWGRAFVYETIRNLAPLNPRLKMDRIPGATVAATPVFPDLAQPVQQGIAKGILAYARHVKREAKFVQGGTRSVSRDFRFALEVPFVQSGLFGARATRGCDNESGIQRFAVLVESSRPWDKSWI